MKITDDKQQELLNFKKEEEMTIYKAFEKFKEKLIRDQLGDCEICEKIKKASKR